MMTVRMGMYATYNGKEYKAAKVNGAVYKLIDDGFEPAAGFYASEFAPLNFMKIVSRNDLDRVYIVKTYAEFKGERFEVMEDNDDTVTITTSDAQAAKRIGMNKIDRYDFRLKVCKSEVVRFIEEIGQWE
ncbi:MAG: hypothetical protein ABFC94_08805 [Syntrophomonas sp.]